MSWCGIIINTNIMENMEKNIKKKCGWCGEPIKGTMEWYVVHGNSCIKCATKANQNLIEARKAEREKKRYIKP